VFAALLCASAVVSPAVYADDLAKARDILAAAAHNRTARTAQALSHLDVRSVDLLPLALRADARLYVYLLQQELRQSGLRNAAPDGTLNRSTISALGRFCRAAGITDPCRRGVLTNETAVAIGKALDSGTPAAEPAPVPAPSPKANSASKEAKEAAPPPTNSASAPAAQAPGSGTAALPAGWSISDLARSGATVTVLESGANSAVLELKQPALGASSWVNVYLGNPVQAQGGEQWRTALDAALVAGSTKGLEQLRLSGAVTDPAGHYLGELHLGADLLELSSDGAHYERAGTVDSDGDVLIQPYLQFVFKPGTAIDLTLRLSAPAIEQVD
jgi:hypothetical protein